LQGGELAVLFGGAAQMGHPSQECSLIFLWPHGLVEQINLPMSLVLPHRNDKGFNNGGIMTITITITHGWPTALIRVADR
jgi:hypothetical protein